MRLCSALLGLHYRLGLAGIGMSIGLIAFPPYPELMNKNMLGIKTFGIVLIGIFLLSLIVAEMFMYSELFVNALIFSGVIALGIFS